MINSRASQRLLTLVVALVAWFGSSTAAPANAEPFNYDAPIVAFGDVLAREDSIAASRQVVSSRDGAASQSAAVSGGVSTTPLTRNDATKTADDFVDLFDGHRYTQIPATSRGFTGQRRDGSGRCSTRPGITTR